MELVEICHKVKNGATFKVDLENKKAWLNGKEIEVESSIRPNNVYFIIEELYRDYKYSYPSERSRKSRYFKALTCEEMTDEQIAKGEDRDYSQAMLEGFVLSQILNGNFKWFDESKYFWQSKNDEELIILRKWVE